MDSASEHLANSSQAHMSERIVPIVNGNHLAVFGAGSLGDDNHRITRPLRWAPAKSGLTESFPQKIKNPFIVKWVFGDEDDMSLTGDAGP